jgi:hypothetical protein
LADSQLSCLFLGGPFSSSSKEPSVSCVGSQCNKEFDLTVCLTLSTEPSNLISEAAKCDSIGN